MDPFEPFWTYQNLIVTFGPLSPSWKSLDQFGTIWMYSHLFGPILKIFEKFGAIRSNLEPYGLIWTQLDLLGA